MAYIDLEVGHLTQIWHRSIIERPLGTLQYAHDRAQVHNLENGSFLEPIHVLLL
jgi:hypothetical protein